MRKFAVGLRTYIRMRGLVDANKADYDKPTTSAVVRSILQPWPPAAVEEGPADGE